MSIRTFEIDSHVFVSHSRTFLCFPNFACLEISQSFLERLRRFDLQEYTALPGPPPPGIPCGPALETCAHLRAPPCFQPSPSDASSSPYPPPHLRAVVPTHTVVPAVASRPRSSRGHSRRSPARSFPPSPSPSIGWRSYLYVLG